MSDKIVIVDDDTVLRELHAAYLEDEDFELILAADGVEALEKIRGWENEIAVMISDVSMPQMDGYELCRRIRAESQTENIPVIFVSALSSLEEKLKGYAVGADDYIIKPVDGTELLEKCRALIERQNKIKSLHQTAKDSRNMAMQAMIFSSELGQVIEFYKNMLASRNYQELVGHLFEAVGHYGLVTTIQIYTPTSVLNLSQEDIVSPLEANVIELARKRERFFDFGSRTIINYDDFSLLIKNMPIDDPEKYGRLKDILGMITNGVEAKIRQLNNDVLADKKQAVMKSIQDSLNSIEQSFGGVQKENILAIEDLNDELNEAIQTLGLTQYQEDNIEKIVEHCLQRINKAFYQGINIRENLTNINNQLLLALRF
jgi:DNA-binding response OmpR family regulator